MTRRCVINNLFICCRLAEQPVAFKTPLKETQTTEGQTATLTCQLTRPSTVTWLKDGNVLTPDESFDLTVDDVTHTLTIPVSTLADEAEYTVTVGDTTTKAMLWVEGTYLYYVMHIPSRYVV